MYFNPNYCINLIVFASICLFSVPLSAQQWITRHFDTTNGLPHDAVYELKQDSKGYIWACTDDGLAKYDGREWTVFRRESGLESNYVIDITEDLLSQQFFISTWGKGVQILREGQIRPLAVEGYYPLKTNRITLSRSWLVAWAFTSISIFQRPEDANLPLTPTNLVFLREKGHGKPFSRTPSSQFDSTNVLHTSYKALGKIGALIDNDTLYIFGKESGIWRVNKGKPAIQVALKGKSANSLVSSQNKLWTSANGKVQCWSKPSSSNAKLKLEWESPRFTDQDLFLNKVCGDTLYLIEKPLGQKAAGDAFRYIISEDKLINLTQKAGINSAPSSIHIDREGNIWIPTDGDGLYQLIESNYEYLDIPAKSSLFINDIAQNSKGQMIIGTKQGLLITYPHSQQIKEVKIASDEVQSVTPLEDRELVMGLTSETWLLNANHKLEYEERKIIGFKDGVRYYLKNGIKQCRGNSPPISIYQSKSETLKAGGLIPNGCVVASDKRLLFFRNLGDSLQLADSIPFPKGLAIERVYDILAESESEIWIATDIGLLHWQKTRGFTYQNQQDGLPADRCFHLLKDKRGSLWVSTAGGLAEQDGNRWLWHNKSSGLLSNSITALGLGPDNKLWVGTGKGITIISLQQSKAHTPPPLHLTAQTGTQVSSEQTAQFEFHALNFTNPRGISYAYRLNGENWTYTKESQAFFNELSPGGYCFEVKARYNHEPWTEVQEYCFKVVPKWYASPLSIFLFSIAGFFLLHQVYQFIQKERALLHSKLRSETEQRTKAEEKLKQVREQIAKDFHDEMGNKLASITVLSSLVAFKLNASKEGDKDTQELLKKIERSSKQLYYGTKDFIWTIDPGSDNLFELFTYMRDFGASFLQPMNLDYYVDTVGEDYFPEIDLPLNWSREIILIGKEAMTNAVKYSKGSKVEFQFAWDAKSEAFSFSISDDGQGFETHLPKTGNGLGSMNDRAIKLGGRLEIESAAGQGTKVTFISPPYPKWGIKLSS